MRYHRRWSLFVFAFGLFVSQAIADSRLAGSWISPNGETELATFSCGVLGKWIIVTQQWRGGAPETRVKYTVVKADAGGTLTADENLAKKPDAPRTINYEVLGGELFLIFPDSSHPGRFRLVKRPVASVPPRPTSTESVAKPLAPRPDQPPAAASATLPAGFLLGNWVSEPGSPFQLHFFIGRFKSPLVKINQEWIKGSDKPVTSKGGIYTFSVNAEGNGGILTKEKKDFEGSEIPLHFRFFFDGETLVLTAEDGPFMGQQRLAKSSRAVAE